MLGGRGGRGGSAQMSPMQVTVAAVVCTCSVLAAYATAGLGLASAFLALGVLVCLFMPHVAARRWRKTVAEYVLVAGIAVTLAAYGPTAKPVRAIHSTTEAGAATGVNGVVRWALLHGSKQQAPTPAKQPAHQPGKGTRKAGAK